MTHGTAAVSCSKRGAGFRSRYSPVNLGLDYGCSGASSATCSVPRLTMLGKTVFGPQELIKRPNTPVLLSGAKIKNTDSILNIRPVVFRGCSAAPIRFSRAPLCFFTELINFRRRVLLARSEAQKHGFLVEHHHVPITCNMDKQPKLWVWKNEKLLKKLRETPGSLLRRSLVFLAVCLFEENVGFGRQNPVPGVGLRVIHYYRKARFLPHFSSFSDKTNRKNINCPC